MMNFGGKPPIFAIFRQFLDNPPLFKENLPKRGPLFGEFGAQKPTHMGGTYPYPQHVMYPPGFDNPKPRYDFSVSFHLISRVFVFQLPQNGDDYHPAVSPYFTFHLFNLTTNLLSFIQLLILSTSFIPLFNI